MRIVYANANVRSDHTGGGHVHVEQFIANAAALGHEMWTYARGHPGAHTIPTSRVSHIRAMRRMDALYVRVESGFPEVCTWALPPRRALYGFPVVVWEYNTVPEHGLLRGRSEDDVRQAVESFRHFGSGCDLAVCVTQSLGEYVKDKLGIQRVLIISNGSDPALFRPDAPRVKRMLPFRDKFSVVWIGTGREPWHDFGMIREAARMLWEVDSGKEVAFHIIGPDVAGIMADMPPNVYYWGAEYYEKLPGWLAGMDVGLNLLRPGPADYSSPLKLFDYMASGLTVVSTAHPFMSELLVQMGQSDQVVPAGDARALADVLVRLASDKERVHRQGQAGRQLVIDRYNWRRAVQDTMNEIEAILREKGKAPKA